MDLFLPAAREANTCRHLQSTPSTAPAPATPSSAALQYFLARECPKRKRFAARIFTLDYPRQAWERRNPSTTAPALTRSGHVAPEASPPHSEQTEYSNLLRSQI